MQPINTNASVKPANQTAEKVQTSPKKEVISKFQQFKNNIRNINTLQATGLVISAVLVAGLGIIVYNYGAYALGPMRHVIGL